MNESIGIKMAYRITNFNSTLNLSGTGTSFFQNRVYKIENIEHRKNLFRKLLDFFTNTKITY